MYNPPDKLETSDLVQKELRCRRSVRETQSFSELSQTLKSTGWSTWQKESKNVYCRGQEVPAGQQNKFEAGAEFQPDQGYNLHTHTPDGFPHSPIYKISFTLF